MENDYGNSQAKTQLESIKGMVAALNVDYDRLEELRDMTNYFIDGVPADQMDMEELEILLCTGGPAVRIIGDLINGQPDCPVLQYQSWGTPWTTYPTTMDEYETLLTYCERFYYGG